MLNSNSYSHVQPSPKPPRIPFDYRNFLRWGFLVVFVGFVVFVFDYHCPFRAIFSLPCPGCGMTRAFLDLLQGRFALSLQRHAMLIPSLICLGLSIVLWFKGKDRWKNAVLYTWVFLMIVYWIWRLIFVFPHSPLF